jgi:hypothetical protein
MTRVNSQTNEVAAYDDADAGEGLAVYFSQNGNSVARYRFLVKAITDQGTFDVGEFYSSPPLATSRPGRPTRMIAGAVCPGATSWAVEVSCVPSLIEGELVLPEDDTAEIILASSKCCTAPIGVTRVAERYEFASGSSPGGSQDFTVLAGQRITGIAAYGLPGGGSVSISGIAGSISVADGVSVNLEPGASIAPNSLITLANVDFVIEYLESA